MTGIFVGLLMGMNSAYADDGGGSGGDGGSSSAGSSASSGGDGGSQTADPNTAAAVPGTVVDNAPSFLSAADLAALAAVAQVGLDEIRPACRLNRTPTRR